MFSSFLLKRQEWLRQQTGLPQNELVSVVVHSVSSVRESILKDLRTRERERY